jgi:hypothetical protein
VKSVGYALQVGVCGSSEVPPPALEAELGARSYTPEWMLHPCPSSGWRRRDGISSGGRKCIRQVCPVGRIAAPVVP